MPEYLSERKRNLQVGIPEYTNNQVVFKVTGDSYITGKLGIGDTNPQSRVSFGTSSIGTLPSQTSLRLYDNNSVSYGFGVNNDIDIGSDGSLSYLDIVANDINTGGIRFFSGDPSISFLGEEKVSIGTDGVYIKNVPLNIDTQLNIDGTVSAKSFNILGFNVINEFLELNNILGLNQVTSDTISFSVANNPKPFSNLEVLGSTTIVNGPFLFGRLESIGTQNQLFEVESGGYFSGSLGIGVTNTTEKLSVNGNVLISNKILHGNEVGFTSAISSSSIHHILSSLVYRFVEYSIQASQDTNFQFTKLIALQDGSQVYTTEYGNVYNNFSLCEYEVQIIDDIISLIVTPNTDSEIKYSINYMATKIDE